MTIMNVIKNDPESRKLRLIELSGNGLLSHSNPYKVIAVLRHCNYKGETELSEIVFGDGYSFEINGAISLEDARKQYDR
jgi:hypothetical protein